MGGNLGRCSVGYSAGYGQLGVSADPEDEENRDVRCSCLRGAFGWWYQHVYAHPVDGSHPSSRRSSGATGGGVRAMTGLGEEAFLRAQYHHANGGLNGTARGYGGSERGAMAVPARFSPRGHVLVAPLYAAAPGRGSERQKRPPLQNSYSESIIRDYERQRVPKEFAARYDMRMLIGVGTTAKVYMCVRRATDTKFACKVIDKRRLDFDLDQKELLLSQLRKEIEILRQLDHPNIVRFEETIETADTIYVVMELVTGGELFDYLLENGAMSEPQAAHLMHGVMSAVAYMHERGVVHRDIKAENLLLVQQKSRCRWPTVKLIDFGFSTTLKNKFTGSFLGTGGYIAPEIRQQRGYSYSVDVWACGVLCYLLVSCRLPFNADVDVLPSERNSKEVPRRYELRFPETQWGLKSEGVKDLIRHMLEVEAIRRWSARQVLQHPWTTGQMFGVAFGTAQLPVPLPAAQAKSASIGGGGGIGMMNGHASGIGGTGNGHANGDVNGSNGTGSTGSNGSNGSNGPLESGSGSASSAEKPRQWPMRHAMSAIDFQLHLHRAQTMQANEAPEALEEEESESGGGGDSAGKRSERRRWERTVSYCPAVIHNVRTGDLMTTSRHSIQRYGSSPLDKRGGPRASLRPPSPAVSVPMPVPKLSAAARELEAQEENEEGEEDLNGTAGCGGYGGAVIVLPQPERGAVVYGGSPELGPVVPPHATAAPAGHGGIGRAVTVGAGAEIEAAGGGGGGSGGGGGGGGGRLHTHMAVAGMAAAAAPAAAAGAAAPVSAAAATVPPRRAAERSSGANAGVPVGVVNAAAVLLA